MNRTLAYILIAIIFIGGGFLTLNAYIYNEKQASGPSTSSGQTE